MNHKIIYSNINYSFIKPEECITEKEYEILFNRFAIFWFEAQVRQTNDSAYKVQDKSIVEFHFESQDGGIWELR